MARKKKPLPLLERITIEDVAAEGKALARVDNLVVFVPYIVPGDVVDLQV
ncbi:MAG: 23S rRNA (uracil-5-)-methyltransferase RumA, partial [Bacteroidaceae bacterium]|nr:23S rRNA (uracil-5-)-methyltransferase RumA [Bacteroidaceae bacterium]